MTAADFLPKTHDLPSLVRAASRCQGCELYKQATQTVFGEGPVDARVMLIAEQPGDQEDQTGRPFVGPAGHVLDEALQEAGIDRQQAYVTNAVKHFKFVRIGKRRLHKKPDSRELNACRPWLEAEIEMVRPLVIVCLGATAAQSLLGRAFRLTRELGQFHRSPWAPWILATYHPSAILRVPDTAARQKMRDQLVADLRLVAQRLVEAG